MCLLAWQNLSVPGLYYDEAVFAGMAKDFVTGQVHGQHMPGNETWQFFGRPFPFFVQTYLGALKCWILIPALYFFGHTVAVVRATNLFCGSIGLLFLMLGTWRWLGIRAALIAGALLAFDPAYFFISIIDWGVAAPSFVCRCLSFFLLTIWWKHRQARYLFLAAFFAGLGFFNKVDFAVLLVAIAGASMVCFARTLRSSLNTTSLIAAVGGFLLGVGAMLFKVPKILGGTLSGSNPSPPGELTEKLNTLRALYDGSYFYRLMNVGGIFERMFADSANFLPIFGGLLLASTIIIVCFATNDRGSDRRIGLFLLLALGLGTLGVIVLPGGVRIHHAVLVYPLPHLIIAFAALVLFKKFSKRLLVPALTWIALAGLFVSDIYVLHHTQVLIRETGGRGRWSESFDTFCRENKDRSDLTLVSLDWGFNEQLAFLTDRPQLGEPFWGFGQTAPQLPTGPGYIYLVHPDEYALFPFGTYYLKDAQNKGSEAEIRPYLDRQNRTAFYTIQYPAHGSR